MQRWALVAFGGAVCVCCVLPAYEGTDMLPGKGNAGSGASSGSGASGGDSNGPTNNNGGSEPGGAGKSNAGSDNGGATNGGSTPSPGGDGGSIAGGTGDAGAGGGDDGPPFACPPGVLGHCDPGATYAEYPGHTLLLVEDFPAPLDLDNDPVFTWSDGANSVGQTRYRKEQISFADGTMLITAQPPNGCPPAASSPGCIEPSISHAEALHPNATINIPAKGVWSGELRTRYNNFRYGRYELKVTAPIANPGNQTSAGMTGNFMLNFRTFTTPRNWQYGEVAFELWAAGHTKVRGFTIGGLQNVAEAPPEKQNFWEVAGPSGYQVFETHVYTFTRTFDTVEWFVDGTKVQSHTSSVMFELSDQPGKIMINMWIFNGNPGPFGSPADNKYPITATFDELRFYKLDSDAAYPCSNPPACLGADLKTKSSQNNPSEMNYGQ